MSEHVATVEWSRGDQPFLDNRYARAHDWRFDGGAVVRGSSAPSALVPVPRSDPAAVDPEEALVAALSSCHMLFFLAFAARGGFIVDSYRDEAAGVLGRDEGGKTSITTVAPWRRVPSIFTKGVPSGMTMVTGMPSRPP